MRGFGTSGPGTRRILVSTTCLRGSRDAMSMNVVTVTKMPRKNHLEATAITMSYCSNPFKSLRRLMKVRKRYADSRRGTDRSGKADRKVTLLILIRALTRGDENV